jgi:hypothetical protein
LLQAETGSVALNKAEADGVECAALKRAFPSIASMSPAHFPDALFYFLRRCQVEGQDQDPARIDPKPYTMRYKGSQSSGLAGASARQHEQWLGS